MSPPPVPGDTHLHRYELHKRVASRLRRLPGVSEVMSSPSPMRPILVEAEIDQTSFFDDPALDGTATLTFAWRPRGTRDEFRIQYHETGASWSCGWHQDEHHSTLGPIHFQVDHEDWATPHRESATFSDPHPMAILEACLEELRNRVPTLPGSVP